LNYKKKQNGKNNKPLYKCEVFIHLIRTEKMYGVDTTVKNTMI
jgi:hypothetical protein